MVEDKSIILNHRYPINEASIMVYSYVGYCKCGYEIWIEYLPNENQWFHRFFDPNHKEITNCPKCGKKINEDDLESL